MNQKVLDKVIAKAKKNGWEHPYNPPIDSCYEMLFNQDFLKALFGEENYYPINGTDCRTDCDFCQNRLKVWQYHGQQMVISKDVFKYLDEMM